MDLAAAYAETRALLLRSLDGGGEAAWELRVPATPDWSVLDAVAHVTGLAVDGATGVLPADLNLLEQFRDPAVVAARDDLADGQVMRRRGRTRSDVLDEWARAEPQLLERLRCEPGDPASLPFGFDAVLVTDLCVHADDIAIAVGAAPHRDTPASRIALATYGFAVGYRLRVLGLPALCLRYEGKDRILGDGPPAATVSADRWELLRVLAGRRSRSQIVQLEWAGDPGPYLPLLPAYGERADDLDEARSG